MNGYKTFYPLNFEYHIFFAPEFHSVNQPISKLWSKFKCYYVRMLIFNHWICNVHVKLKGDCLLNFMSMHGCTWANQLIMTNSYSLWLIGILNLTDESIHQKLSWHLIKSLKGIQNISFMGTAVQYPSPIPSHCEESLDNGVR